MKRSTFLCALMWIAFSAIAAFAADVTGAWVGKMGPPGEEGFQLVFTFKQSGAEVTGSVQGPGGDPINISEGKMDGDKLSFNTSFNGATIKHEGVVKGDEVKLAVKSSGGDFPDGEIVLKKSK